MNEKDSISGNMSVVFLDMLIMLTIANVQLLGFFLFFYLYVV